MDCEPPLSDVELVDAPDGAAAYLAKLIPGADAVAGLAGLDPAMLSASGRVDALVAIEKQLAWLAAMQQRVLAAMPDPLHPDDPKDLREELARGWVREDVSCALRLGSGGAQQALVTAHDLTHRLPDTLRALDRGVISARQARVLAEAVAGLDDETANAVESAVLGRAGEQTLAGFRRSVSRAVQTIDPRRAEERREQGMEERRVCRRPVGDGMAELWALLPAEGAAAIMAAVNALARECEPGDGRTADQRRADALVDLAVAALHDPRLPRAQGKRPDVQVTVALSTLLGLDEQPGDLAGHGPIPASVARRMAADPTGTWRRLVTDPASGKLLDYGRTTYRPPADLADFVVARDGTCTFPTCARSARHGDLDHETPYDADGATNPDNLAAMCRRHHRAKHEAGWKPDRDPGTGESTWTSPTGHRYRSRPEPYPADRTTQTGEPTPSPADHHAPPPF